MSLQGSLQQLGLADVLQTALQGREGNLYLRHGATRAVLHVAASQIYLVEPEAVDAERLLEAFVHRDLLAPEALAAARDRRETTSDVIEALLEEGALPRMELDSVLRNSVEDAILDLLIWPGGDFRFEEGHPPPPSESPSALIGIDTGGVLLRAAQRLDERSAIAEALGYDTHLFTPGAGRPPAEDEFDPTPAIHALLDGSRTVDEIALLAGVSRFAALRSIFQCVQAGAAHLPPAETLREQFELRREAGAYSVSRGLLLQWAAADPGNPEPLDHLAALAREHQRGEEEADALLNLGHLLLRSGRAPEAQEILHGLVAHRPGDTAALSALCDASEAAGDQRELTTSVLQLAEAALEDDEPTRAVSLLERLVRGPEAPLAAHVLRARAFIRLKDRPALLMEAEVVLRILSGGSRERDIKETATFFRDAVGTLAPERTDLLRRFRSLAEGNRRSFQRVAIIAALVVVAATAGVILWPASPGRILEQAQAAAAAGDNGTALELIERLVAEHPDAPEATDAYLLQARILKPAVTRPPVPQEEDRKAQLDVAFQACSVAVLDLPVQASIDALDVLQRELSHPAQARSREAIVRGIAPALETVLDRIERDVRLRTDTLGHARDVARSGNIAVEELRELVAAARKFAGDGYVDRVLAVTESVARFVALFDKRGLGQRTTVLRRSAERLQATITDSGRDLEECRRLLALHELEIAHEACRSEAAKLLVQGRLDEADLYYVRLQELLATIEKEPVLQPVLEAASRRLIPEFLQHRRAVLDEIRRGLLGARTAEQAGDLPAAVRAYQALAERFWHVRFENVIRLPLRVDTTPAGARIFLNGKEAGSTPTVVHYPWGTQVTVTVVAPGYETATRVLHPGAANPEASLEVRLAPTKRWSAPIDATVVAPPSPIEGDVLVTARGGQVSRLAGADGHVRWARHIRSLEGIRTRAIAHEGLVYLPFIDGTLHILDGEDGQPLGQISVGRPAGQASMLGDLLLIPNAAQRIVAVRGRERVFDVALPSRFSCGTVVAHGALWLGTSRGQIVRIDHSGAVGAVALPGREAPVVGLVAFPDGFLATRSDGSLHRLDRNGRATWTTEALGDLVGNPAVAGNTAAVVDRRGRVLIFNLDTSDPVSVVTLKAEPVGGVLGTDELLVLALSDGRLWVYDPVTQVERANVDLGGAKGFAPALLGAGRIAVSTAKHTLSVVETARMSATEDE